MTGVDPAVDTGTMLLNFLPVLDAILVVAVSLRIFSRRSAHGTAVAWLLLIDDIDAVFTKNGLAIFCQLLNSDYFSTANLDTRGDFALTRRDKFNM